MAAHLTEIRFTAIGGLVGAAEGGAPIPEPARPRPRAETPPVGRAALAPVTLATGGDAAGLETLLGMVRALAEPWTLGALAAGPHAPPDGHPMFCVATPAREFCFFLRPAPHFAEPGSAFAGVECALLDRTTGEAASSAADLPDEGAGPDHAVPLVAVLSDAAPPVVVLARGEDGLVAALDGVPPGSVVLADAGDAPIDGRMAARLAAAAGTRNLQVLVLHPAAPTRDALSALGAAGAVLVVEDGVVRPG